MTFLPIVERELRVAARVTATYRNRAIAAGLVMGAAMVMLLFGSRSGVPSRAGASTFSALSFVTLIFCILEGVRKTADCLSEEKREGTLGLLFLTDLKGYDVVLGKLAATSLSSVYGLVGILPVLALPMLAGGVTAAEFWRVVLAMVNTLFFSLCVGMLVSACCRNENSAMAVTLFVVMFFIFVPRFFISLEIAPLSPAYAYQTAFASNYFRNGQHYWQTLAITQGLSWLMLISASIILPRSWQEKGSEPAQPQWWRQSRLNAGSSAQRAQERAKLLDMNPALWLAARHSGLRLFLWTLVAGLGVCGAIAISGYHNSFVFPVFFPLAWLVNFILKMRIASEACHCLAEARRNNALEMMLATPLSVNEIIRGQILALKRIFLVPMIAILSIEILTVACGFIRESKNSHYFALDGLVLVAGMGYFALFFLDVAAVVWTGMWFGLTAKKESRAITKTVLLVLVLPFASSCFWVFGLLFYIGIPIFWIAWSSQRLRSEFRIAAAQRFAPQAMDPGWLPQSPHKNVPPVISG